MGRYGQDAAAESTADALDVRHEADRSKKLLRGEAVERVGFYIKDRGAEGYGQH